MYLPDRPNDVMAGRRQTASLFWLYLYHTQPSPDSRVCFRRQQSGRRHAGHTLYMAPSTLILLRSTPHGSRCWNIQVGDVKLAYSINHGASRREVQIMRRRGGRRVRHSRVSLQSYDAKTGKERGVSTTIP